VISREHPQPCLKVLSTGTLSRSMGVPPVFQWERGRPARTSGFTITAGTAVLRFEHEHEHEMPPGSHLHRMSPWSREAAIHCRPGRQPRYNGVPRGEPRRGGTRRRSSQPSAKPLWKHGSHGIASCSCSMKLSTISHQPSAFSQTALGASAHGNGGFPGAPPRIGQRRLAPCRRRVYNVCVRYGLA
jgi:hypothetical protein